ncbi:MAG: hypothetical protein KatS3mg085_104 [Candidatus Dojkabacteria bacterium]|nr:MAG: hypothetical protein KatS3mg085_104 [Candidatus Dojkabacteria bacterium]
MKWSFLNILNDALLPASLMIVSKFIGVFVVVLLFNLDWSLEEYSNQIFAFGTTKSVDDAIIITSYSDLFMYLVMVLFLSFSIIRAVFFHSTHINPEIFYKLTLNNLSDLVKNSFVIYKSATIWLIFTIFANLVILANSVLGKSFAWIGLLTASITISLAVILASDVSREIKSQKNIK